MTHLSLHDALPISSGWIGTVDFLFEQVRHVVEIDSSWHDGPRDRAADAERDEALRAAGYTVERYRSGRLVGEPAAAARDLAWVHRSEDRLIGKECGSTFTSRWSAYC